MDPTVFYTRPATQPRSQTMEEDRNMSPAPVRGSRRARARSTSEESTVSIELTRSGGDKPAKVKVAPPTPAGHSVPSNAISGKTVAFMAEPYGHYHNSALDTEEEFQHTVSDMSQELNGGASLDIQASGSLRGGSSTSDSSIRIEIRDSGHEGSSNFTTSTLHKCKREVLRPYWHLLIFIGWRGFNRESIFAQGFRWRFLNFLYTSIVMSLLIYTYSYEVLTCEWKLDMKTDTLPIIKGNPSTLPPPTTTTLAPSNSSNSSILTKLWGSTFRGYTSAPHTKGDNDEVTKEEVHVEDDNPACDHIVTSYLIPGLLHFAAYVLGFYYFRVQENEQLDALMEKVFLQATTHQARTASQQNMIKKQRYYLSFGGCWVFVSALLQVLYMWAFDFPQMPIFKKVPKNSAMVLFGLEILGRAMFNAVLLAIVMNFVTQCEMIKFYVKGLVMRLQEKSTDLRTAMKDVLTLRQTLSQLNGLISKMTTLAGVILAELTVIGVFLLLVNKNTSPKVWAYRAIFPLVWAVMFAFPLFQAARVNSICLRIHKVALEMRVFGYKGASLLDLDSFLSFVNNTKLSAKLFHINVIPSQLIFVCLVGAFVLLVLIQTSNIGPANLII